MAKKQFQIVIWKEGKHYVAQCLDVEVSSFGKTRADALKNVTEALELYFSEPFKRKIAEVKQPKIVSLVLAHA